jgi:putative ABC transport system ATP-binding protein
MMTAVHPTLASPLSSQTKPTGLPLIEIDQVFKHFKSGSEDMAALKNINAAFYQGEFVSIIGKSGSGKSTLINMITGIDHPSTGTVQVANTYIHKLSESEMSVWRGLNLGIVFQFFQLLPMLSLIENVMLPMDFANRIPAGERETRAMQLLERVDLVNFAHKLPEAVSGGQQQSAAIARALANDPPIIIADEPTGNLDSRTAETVIQLFEELVAQGKTILMVTHDPSLASRTSRSLLICDGEIIPEAVARALPSLRHTRMLQFAHQATEKQYQPGETLMAAGSPPRWVHVLVSGAVNVVGSKNTLLQRVGAGNLIDEAMISNAGAGQIQINASEGEPLETLSLEIADYQQIVSAAQHSTIASTRRQP